MRRVAPVLLFLCLASVVRADGGVSAVSTPEKPVLIVDRRAESISLFLSLPAQDLKPVFGTGADALLGADGTVDIDGLYEGTFDLADRIFAPVQTTIGGTPVAFEALSMMVHDPEALPPFQTPWDGETSIAVCTSPETVDKMGLETLQAYLGFFAWKVNGLAALDIVFPQTGTGPVEIEIRDFWNMQHTGTRTETIGDGQAITLKPGQGARLGGATLWLMSLALAGVGAVFFALHARRAPADRITG